MRIVGGTWAGTPLVSPGGRVRPTAETLRVAWMDMVAEALSGARILDLFAGTGALGLEALSRGAASVDFVENGPAALHALKANIAKVRAKARNQNRIRLFRKDVVPFLEGVEAGAWDLAFADPPWGSRLLERVVDRWHDVPFATVLVVEHAADREPPPGGRTRRFGDAALTTYRLRRRRSGRRRR